MARVILNKTKNSDVLHAPTWKKIESVRKHSLLLDRKINLQKSTTFLYRQKNAIIFKTLFIITRKYKLPRRGVRHRLCKTVMGKKKP